MLQYINRYYSKLLMSQFRMQLGLPAANLKHSIVTQLLTKACSVFLLRISKCWGGTLKFLVALCQGIPEIHVLLAPSSPIFKAWNDLQLRFMRNLPPKNTLTSQGMKHEHAK